MKSLKLTSIALMLMLCIGTGLQADPTPVTTSVIYGFKSTIYGRPMPTPVTITTSAAFTWGMDIFPNTSADRRFFSIHRGTTSQPFLTPVVVGNNLDVQDVAYNSKSISFTAQIMTPGVLNYVSVYESQAITWSYAYSHYGLYYNPNATPGMTLVNYGNIYLATNTPTASITKTTYVTRTITPTHTPTRTATGTKTATITKTVTLTKTITQTITPMDTKTATQTITQTHTITPTYTATPTITLSETITPTFTITSTLTITPTSTPIRTACVISYVSTDALNHQTDVTVQWDMIGYSYVLTLSNTAKVLYPSDNMSQFPDDVFVYTLKNLIYDKTYPVRVTVQAVDGSMVPSNHIYVSPAKSPTVTP